MNKIKAPNFCVTTGKCDIPIWKNYELFNLKDTFDETFRQFVICGNHLSSQEIYEFDNIICFYSESEINNQFIIVRTNKELYNNIVFDYTIRKSLLYIEGRTDIEDIIEQLKEKDFPQIFLEENRNQLRTLYRKTIDIFKYDDLVLSYTYDYGHIMFSLDNIEDVEYDVKIVVPINSQNKRIYLYE